MSASLGELVGERMRAAREEAGVTLDGVARAANLLGLTTWRRNTVGELEKGRRRLTVEEFVALTVVLDVAGCRTLQPDGPALILAGDKIRLGEGWDVQGSAFLALAGQTRDPALTVEAFGALPGEDPLEQDRDDDATRLPADPAELKATESLRKVEGLGGLTPVKVQKAALSLWGRRIAEERDRRLSDHEGTTPRGMQALRGHMTRALLEELRSVLLATKETGS